MTQGDFQADRQESPLRAARRRSGWNQAAAMNRFAAAVNRLGGTVPEGESLKRMFAYWEAGTRAVTLPAYRRAFREIYETSDATLGFVPPDHEGRVAEMMSRPLDIIAVDEGLVELFESQTDHLRELDRRLGSAAQALMAQAHVDQIDFVLHRTVGPHRSEVAAALAEAAALAGWQALDRADTASAWDLHETAKSAAHESGSHTILAHVMAQQAFVLLDVEQAEHANDAVDHAMQVANGVPALLEAWLAAAKGETLAAVGDSDGARRSMERADELLAVDDVGTLPFLMLTPEHLMRWRGHCLARLGDAEAIEMLPLAISAENDSVRAALSLHADMALALANGGFVHEALDEAATTLRKAERYGSARQRKRLVRILGIA